jgi:hypothetical protein
MALTPKQAKEMLRQAGVSVPTAKPSLTPEQARTMLQQAGIQPVGAQIKPQEEQLVGPAAMSQGMGESALAGLTGGLQGVLDFAAAIGSLPARGYAALTGQPFQEAKVDVSQISPAARQLMAQHPIATTVGEVAGGAVPALALGQPELALAGRATQAARALGAGERLAPALGRITGTGAIGAVLGAGYAPEEPATKSAAEGALLSVGTLGLGNLLANAPRQTMKLLRMGGAATKEGAEKVINAAKELGVNMPLAEIIKSPGLAKLQKIGLKNIPFAGMTQVYQNLAEGLSGQLQGLLDKLNPANEHSGAAVQDFLGEKYNQLKEETGKLYQNLRSNIQNIAPGDIHANDGMLNEVNKITEEFTAKLKRPGGKIKVPQAVKDYIEEVRKENVSVNAAILDDEIINANIGDAIAEVKKGGKAAKDAERSLGYFRRLKEANLRDIDQTIEKVDSPEITSQWKEAKNFYKENLAPYTEKGSLLKQLITEPNIDKIQSKFLQVSGQQPKTEILKNVVEQLPQDVVDKVAHAHLLGPKDGDLIDAIKRYNKLQPKQQSLLFSTEDKKILDNLSTIEKHVGKKEFNQMFVPPTGAQVQMALGGLTMPAAFEAGLRTAGLPGAVAAPAALIGGARGLKAALMSDALKNLYLRSLASAERPARRVAGVPFLGMPLMSSNRKENEQ